MKLEIKKIEKASLIFEKIKNLNAEIKSIENSASFVSCNNIKVQLKLTLSDSANNDDLINSMTEVLEGLSRNPIYPPSDWNSPVNRPLTRLHPITHDYYRSVVHTHPNDNNVNLLTELSETATMQILGIVLCEKQKQMKVLIEELEELGFYIQKK